MKKEEIIKGSLVKSKLSKTVVEVIGIGKGIKTFSEIVVVETSSYKLGHYSDTWCLNNFEVVIEDSNFLKQNATLLTTKTELVELGFKTITTICKVGKSPKEVNLVFLAKDFEKMLDGILYVKGEKYKIEEEQWFGIINQLNEL